MGYSCGVTSGVQKQAQGATDPTCQLTDIESPVLFKLFPSYLTHSQQRIKQLFYKLEFSMFSIKRLMQFLKNIVLKKKVCKLSCQMVSKI